jgi:hypothetical protein
MQPTFAHFLHLYKIELHVPAFCFRFPEQIAMDFSCVGFEEGGLQLPPFCAA